MPTTDTFNRISGMRADVVRESWDQAIRDTDLDTKGNLYSMATNVSNMPDSGMVAGIDAMRRNQSQSSQQLFNTFSKRLDEADPDQIRRQAMQSNIPEQDAIARAAYEAPGKAMSGVSKGALASSNIKAAEGNTTILNHARRHLSHGATLGIGATLSTPQDLVGPGASIVPLGGIPRSNKGGQRMKPENMMPTGKPQGQPTPPKFLKANEARIAPQGSSKNLHVRAIAKSGTNVDGIVQGVSGATGGNQSVNVNLQDNRSSLNPHVLANSMN